MKERMGASQIWGEMKIFDRLLLLGKSGIGMEGNESVFQEMKIDKVVKTKDFRELPREVRIRLRNKFEVDQIRAENQLIDRLNEIR